MPYRLFCEMSGNHSRLLKVFRVNGRGTHRRVEGHAPLWNDHFDYAVLLRISQHRNAESPNLILQKFEFGIRSVHIGVGDTAIWNRSFLDHCISALRLAFDQR